MEKARGEVSLRAVEEADVELFFEHQADPEAAEMAAFTARDRAAHADHWAKIRRDESLYARTILFDGEAVGNVVSWVVDGRRAVGYWIGKSHWGRGIATRALSLLLEQVTERPLYAYVARHNAGSIRVLAKCGFAAVEEREHEGVVEVVMRLGD